MMDGTVGTAVRIRGDAIWGGMPIDGTTSIVITINSDLKTKLSKGRYTAGMINGSVPDRKPSDMDVKFDQFTTEQWKLAFMGSSAALSQGAGSVTDEAITATLGKFVGLTKRNLTAGTVVVTNSGATTTYVEGTDYTVNYKLGKILPLASGAITEAQPLKVDFDHAALTGFKINAEAVINMQDEFILDGVNEADGSNVTLTIPMCRMVSKSKLDFLGDDFGSADMKATPILKSGETAPYYIEVWD